VRVECYEGKYHAVDSSDMASATPRRTGCARRCARPGRSVLEPVSRLTVTVPAGLQGDVLGDLSARRGRISSTTVLDDGRELIQAMVPEAELSHYVLDLRSLTGGRGVFDAAPDHYDIVPRRSSPRSPPKPRATASPTSSAPALDVACMIHPAGPGPGR